MAQKSSLTIEERFSQFEKAKQKPQTPEPRARIQRVAHHLRHRKHFTKNYLPRLVSLGPIHYGDQNLQAGEKYKLKWAAAYIDTCDGQTPQTLHKKIVDDMENLKHLFDSDLLTNNDLFSNYWTHEFSNLEEKICWMLFVDGCALLHILDCAKLDEPEKMNIKIDQLVLVMQDVLLLENQLPYPLLRLLWKDSEAKLMETMKNFLRCHHWATKEEDKLNIATTFQQPIHLLDLQRTIILHNPHPERDQKQNQNDLHHAVDVSCCYEKCDEGNSSDMVTYRNIQELKEAGIGLKTSHTRRPRDISFARGWLRSELTLPEIVVDDTTAATVLNLIAYEMCPDFENDYGICSFVAFLDSLIDHPDDVKALRYDGILLNSLGSDEEVAKLFNTIGTDLVPDMGIYSSVRDQINSHYSNRCKTWLALGYHTYFSNPWAIIAFHAAVLGLALTFIQTWFAIHPSK